MEKTEHNDSGWLRRWGKQRWLLLVGVVLLVLLIAFVVYIVATDQRSQTVDAARQSARKAADDGAYTQAYRQLKAALEQPQPEEQKIDLYHDLAAAAANSNKLVEAIGYLQLKHQLAPKTAAADAQMLATLYENIGDGAKALQSYKQALTYYRSLPKNADLDARIQGLMEQIMVLENAE
jgi:tetratricopeptide (TPR) repeat protein